MGLKNKTILKNLKFFSKNSKELNPKLPDQSLQRYIIQEEDLRLTKNIKNKSNSLIIRLKLYKLYYLYFRNMNKSIRYQMKIYPPFI